MEKRPGVYLNPKDMEHLKVWFDERGLEVYERGYTITERLEEILGIIVTSPREKLKRFLHL